MCGPTAKLHFRSWLQFADDTALISHDIRGAQALLDLNSAWCEWVDMKIRIDKCSTFGMRKQSGNYSPYQPSLSVGGQQLPTIADESSFKYLVKCFDFKMDHSYIKLKLEERLADMLKTTSKLNVKPHQKLKILRLFIRSQLSFDLRIHSISYTWIEENLDSQISNSIRDWLELPVSSCVMEIASLSPSHGGLNIPALRDMTEKLRLSQRVKLHQSTEECRSLWEMSSDANVNLDSIIFGSETKSSAVASLTAAHLERNFEHVNLSANPGQSDICNQRRIQQNRNKPVDFKP